LGIVTQSLSGPAALLPAACDEAVVLSTAELGPPPAVPAAQRDRNGDKSLGQTATNRLVMGDLARAAGRPLSLLSALVDPHVVVSEYVHQESGQRAIFADWQIAQQADAQQWLIKKRVAGGAPLTNDVA